MFRNDALRRVSTNTLAHVYEHSRRWATGIFRPIFPDFARAGESSDPRNRNCDLPGFTFPLTKMLSVTPHQRMETGANAEGDGSKRGPRRKRTRNMIKFQNLGALRFGRTSGGKIREPNFWNSAVQPSVARQAALLVDAVVACSPASSESMRERRDRGRFAVSR